MRYPDEVRERMVYLQSVGKSYQEIGDAVGLTPGQVSNFLRKHYAAMQKKHPEQYPQRKPGRQPKPELSRKDLEKIIKEQKKLLKLYRDFLHLAGRM
jgi:transposase-like protein